MVVVMVAFSRNTQQPSSFPWVSPRIAWALIIPINGTVSPHPSTILVETWPAETRKGSKNLTPCCAVSLYRNRNQKYCTVAVWLSYLSVSKSDSLWQQQASGSGGSMKTSSNGNIFRVTGHLRGELTGHRWIPRTKASDAELWCFLWSAPE